MGAGVRVRQKCVWCGEPVRTGLSPPYCPRCRRVRREFDEAAGLAWSARLNAKSSREGAAAEGEGGEREEAE
jgi:hypothetical protein